MRRNKGQHKAGSWWAQQGVGACCALNSDQMHACVALRGGKASASSPETDRTTEVRWGKLRLLPGTIWVAALHMCLHKSCPGAFDGVRQYRQSRNVKIGIARGFVDGMGQQGDRTMRDSGDTASRWAALTLDLEVGLRGQKSCSRASGWMFCAFCNQMRH